MPLNKVPDTMSRTHTILVLTISILITHCKTQLSSEPIYVDKMCTTNYCICRSLSGSQWTKMECKVPNQQNVKLLEGELTTSLNDLFMRDGGEVYFGPNVLTTLKKIRQIRIINATSVLFRKYTSVNYDGYSLTVEIYGVKQVRIEEKAFYNNSRGPVSVIVKDCDYIYIESGAFSWLLSISIENVGKVELAPGAFMLESSASNIGRHGPGLTILMKNITLPEFPAKTFGSSSAKVYMEFVNVETVYSNAFSANTYNNVIAINCSFHLIQAEAFAQKSLIYNLELYGCRVKLLASGAIKSAISHLNISYSRFKTIESGAINTTVAQAEIIHNQFNLIMTKGLELSSWNKLVMTKNTFDELGPYGILAQGANSHELVFMENQMETASYNSLAFIGETQNRSGIVVYGNNYFGKACFCNITSWLGNTIGLDSGEDFTKKSYCTVQEVLARCFNVPDQNMKIDFFLEKLCKDMENIKCEPYRTKTDGSTTQIKNTRFPHINDEQPVLNDRDKKIIGIVIGAVLISIAIVMVISFIRCMNRRGLCNRFLCSCACGNLSGRLCNCGRSNSLQHRRSMSQISVIEYSERHLLNEPRVNFVTETPLTAALAEVNMSPHEELLVENTVPMDDKTTQTLPEELTKELLENLKEKLEDPENYVEAREMIEHLYELVKVEESCNANSYNHGVDENIYELPFQNTAPRIGKNKKQMISVATRTPSLDRLMPLSPYNRQTALAHEYFEPKDFAVHLYAEIANYDKEKKALMNAMPDIVAEQAIPRGPYLRSKMASITNPRTESTINSTTSSSSGKMVNRPLPKKPDFGEGTSYG